MAGGAQFATQFAKVVDLAIADQPERSILVSKGLMASGQVDDGQSTHADDTVAIVVPPLIVRTAVTRNIAHSLHERRIGKAAVKMNDTVNTAHGPAPSSN